MDAGEGLSRLAADVLPVLPQGGPVQHHPGHGMLRLILHAQAALGKGADEGGAYRQLHYAGLGLPAVHFADAAGGIQQVEVGLDQIALNFRPPAQRGSRSLLAAEEEQAETGAGRQSQSSQHPADHPAAALAAHPAQVVHFPLLLPLRFLFRFRRGHALIYFAAVTAFRQMLFYGFPALRAGEPLGVGGQQIADHAAGQIIFHRFPSPFSAVPWPGRR